MKSNLLICFLLIPMLLLAQPDRLRLASDIYPPFTNVESQQRVATQLVNEALKRDKIVAITEIMDFSQVLNGIESGQYDGSAALWINEERQEELVFSQPYLQNRLILVGRKGADVSITSFDELSGQKVAIVRGYAYGEDVDKGAEVSFVVGENNQQNLRKLLAEEVDYMVVDELLVQYLKIYHQQEFGQHLEAGTTPLIVQSLHLALSKDVPDVEALIADFDQRIKEMAADGTYNRILQVSWIQVDADGDGVLEYVLSGNKAGTTAPLTGYSLFAADGGANATDQYLIDGNVYKGWQSVPNQYKAAPTSDETLNKLRILDFAVPTPKN